MIATLLAEAANPLTSSEFDIPENIAFAIIAGLMLFSALKMVTTGNVMHAALYLVIVLSGVAALFILLGSDFVGATQVMVYIGAIIVLFLFGIMLTRAQMGDDDSVESERRTMGAIVGVLLLVVMGYALIDTFRNEELVFTEPETVEYVVTEVALGDLPTPVRDAFERFDGLPDSTLVELSVEEVDSLPIEVARRVPGAELFGNNKEIADSIFSQYIVAFEAVSVLLLAALIGAIVVARKE
jgi:NADH-quinone oxidoreductase subunit J